MAVNLIDSNDITVSQSGTDIQLNTAISVQTLDTRISNLQNSVNELTDKNDASLKMIVSDINTITPLVGNNHENYGNSWYYKKNTKVYVHLGLNGLTANTTQTVFNMPEGFRPYSKIALLGQGASYTSLAGGEIGTDGTIKINSTSQYAMINVEYDAFN